MKTPEEQRQDQVQAQSKAKKLSDLQNSEDLKFCEILLDDFSRQGKVDIEFQYYNKGEVGKCKHKGIIFTQEFSVVGVSKILRKHGWDVHWVPDSSEMDRHGMMVDLQTGKVQVKFPENVEVGIAPVGKGVIRPSEYLAILQSKLSPVLVEMEIGKLCDSELKAKREFEVELTPYWKVRQHIFVPYVDKHGWVVDVLLDKVVIKYPEDTETED